MSKDEEKKLYPANSPADEDFEHTMSLPTVATVTINTDDKKSGDGKLFDGKTPVFNNDYVFLRPVGSGGGGVVWKSIQVRLDRVVAVKTVAPPNAEMPDGPLSTGAREQKRFFQEAMLAARLDHPNVVPVYDVGVREDGSPLIAMKLVRGKPWNVAIRDDWEVMAPEEFLQRHLPIYVQMMQAVGFAHSRGVVHRDLKPSQVMLGEFGEVVLLDWGLAVLLDKQQSPWSEEGLPAPPRVPLPDLITAGSPAGTPALMAPEQTLPHSRQITERTDIYLLGGILYRLLCGSFPHSAESSTESLAKAAKGDVTPPRERDPGRPMPEELVELAMWALKPDPNDRPHAVRVLLEKVQDYMTGSSARRKSGEHLEEAKTAVAALAEWGLSFEDLPNGDFRVNLSQAEAPKVDRVYPLLQRARLAADNATAAWSANPGLGGLGARIAAAQALVAAETGDLRVARHLMAQVKGERALAALGERIQRAEALRARNDNVRRGAVAAVVMLLGMLALGAYQFGAAQREANRQLAAERDAADQARVRAVQQQRLAEEANRRATAQSYFSSISLANMLFAQGETDRVREILLRQTPEQYRHWEWGHLWRGCLTDAATLQLIGEANELLTATYSTNGQFIYSGDRQGEIRIWEAATGNLLQTAKPHKDGVWDILPSPGGQALLATSFDGTATLLDPLTLRVRQRLEHGDLLRRGAWSHDGRRVATTGNNGIIRVWDAQTGELIWQREDTTNFYDLDFDSEGRYLAAARRSIVLILDAETGQTATREIQHPENVLSLQFSPDGSLLLTACTDRNARVFSVSDQEEVLLIENKTSWLHYAQWAPDGQRILTADNEGAVRVWDAQTAERLAEVRAVPRAYRAVLSPNGRHVVTAAPRAVQIWDLEEMVPDDSLVMLKHEPIDIPDAGTRFNIFAAPFDTSWGGFDTLFRGSTSNARLTYRGRDFSAAVDSFYATFDPLDDRVAQIEFEKHVATVEDLATGELTRPWGDREMAMLRWSPDGKHLAAVASDGTFALHDGRTLEQRAVLGEPCSLKDFTSGRVIGALAFSADSKRLFTGDRCGGAIIWGTSDGKEQLRLEQGNEAIFTAAFSPDGRYFAEGGLDGTANVFDAQTGQHIAEMASHSTYVISVAFHPDNKRLITVGHDDTLRLWETNTGRELGTVIALPDQRFLLGGGFTADGRHIVAVDSEAMLLVATSMDWNLEGTPEDVLRALELEKRRERLNPQVNLEDIDLISSPATDSAN